jgi:hypothetical protein
VLHVLCTGLLSLLALSAPAAAQRRPQATFSVTAEGTESVSATMPAKEEDCPAGTATETDQFAGAPFRIRIEDTGPFLQLTGLSRHGEDARQPFTVAGSVTRSENGSFTCRLLVPPDCGTRAFSGLSMWLQGSSLRRGRITLLVSLHGEDPQDVFSSCSPFGGFPALFVVKPPQAHVTAATLFDRRRRTLVLSASHLTDTEALGGTSHLEASLKLTLRRL